ncbi:hypothetical protein LRS03_04490 [Rhizobacter sp. J219]|jgi:hypothetical protein|uniref:Uncharacterized protein n=1 Tax=Piscinibacter gummiphilus TaxID=946333 RepID=A0ABZ0D611_9BURK|nr:MULTISPECIES: hypothetical protein [Burkholderiales]MCR5882157.1 hypothetical protein [Rhizobacter sp. J219]WOB10961.1 hypothetical protein RXV79_13105 [Piscinibacter gummiphilus]
MISMLKVFDAYSMRARLFPASIAASPALAAIAMLISWKSLELSNTVATLALVVLLFAIADFARERGRAVERKLYASKGGMPSVTMFRYSDPTIDQGSKERYRTFLAAKLGKPVPGLEAEQADVGAADSFYDQCGVWLREQTRDTKKFALLFGENVTYGFRRNLLGVKWLALLLNLGVVVICTAMLWYSAWDLRSAEGKRIIVVLIVAAGHAAYMLLAVRQDAVWDAARTYGRQLILSTEVLLKQQGGPKEPGAGTAAKTTSARKRTSTKSKKPEGEVGS